jgi:REP element-mobilizing transposase RayT
MRAQLKDNIMETSNPNIYHRRSIRLKDYDYSQSGAYFVTINTYQREPLFGQISEELITLNELGKIIQSCWVQIPLHFPTANIDVFVVMPNHIHGVVMLNNENTPIIKKGTRWCAPTEIFGKPTKNSLPTIIRSLKTITTIQINKLRRTPREPVWQRNYYEHIIRDDEELNEIREYIMTNPAKWASDRENPAFRPPDKL